jgi:ABC-2 type transport system permease protein
MRPLLAGTLQQRRRSIIWWSVGVSAFILLTLIFYPTIHSQSDQLNKSLGHLSQTTKQLFTDTGDLFSPLGYLSSQLFYLMLPLLLSVLAISLGTSLIGREERDSTIELLLSRPVSRTRYLLAKAAAGTLIVAAVGLISTIVTIIICKAVDLEVPAPDILAAGAAVILLSLSLGALAFFVAALGRAGRSASIGIASVYGLGGYIIYSLSQSIDWLKGPAKLFPFSYYHASELLTGSYNWLNALFFVALALLFTLLAWLVFRRRDLLGS